MARTEPGRGDPVNKSSARARLGPTSIRPGLVDTSTVYVYMYIVYVLVYVVLTLVMRGKPRNKVLNTTVTKLFLLHMYCTVCTTTAHLLLPYCSIWLRKCYTDYCTLAMYTTMHEFHCLFLNEKHCILIVYITEFSQKIGGQMHYWPPIRSGGGGAWPPGPPPRGGPHDHNS